MSDQFFDADGRLRHPAWWEQQLGNLPYELRLDAVLIAIQGGKSVAMIARAASAYPETVRGVIERLIAAGALPENWIQFQAEMRVTRRRERHRAKIRRRSEEIYAARSEQDVVSEAYQARDPAWWEQHGRKLRRDRVMAAALGGQNAHEIAAASGASLSVVRDAMRSLSRAGKLPPIKRITERRAHSKVGARVLNGRSRRQTEAGNGG